MPLKQLLVACFAVFHEIPVAAAFGPIISFPSRHNNGNNHHEKARGRSTTGILAAAEAVIDTIQIDTSDGIRSEVMYSLPQRGKRSRSKPPLVFLHGSFHASWCWAEHFFPHFTDLGHPVIGLSWRGTNGTYAGEGVKKVKASEHCQDLDAFLQQVPSILGTTDKPVLIGHSFGGIVMMKFLEGCATRPAEMFGGIVLMCSVPPSGNGKMTMRFLQRSLVQSWKITAGFAMKRCIQDKDLCRDLFFGGRATLDENGNIDDFGISDEDLERYQQHFQRDTAATIDLLDLGKQLPIQAVDDRGRAPFHDDLPPCLVIEAKDDFIVDSDGNIETARYFGLDEDDIVSVDSPHDVMLGRKWGNAAAAIESFLTKCN